MDQMPPRLSTRSALGAGLLGLVAAFALMTSGAAWAQSVPGRPDAKAGAELAQKLCTNCHLIGAASQQTTANPDVPSFKQIANFDDQSRERITIAIVLPTHPMPMIELTREETGHLVEYVLSLKTAD